ncbi:hypothetical protein [Nocardiopsis metallicus]|uniref:Uncharacterized protein n=1 Tax=Nocardiopsis metallicus TaxID=179819 RepID=A0A840WJW4_9ACTN|nr:hypothetical protein [Nocardiopsis metallicus]MBB5495773.1 hypothetical protein [Nocardiopsis metallicus]
MYENDPTPASLPLTRECEWGCDWQIVSDSARVADLEAATHTVEAHASLPQRHRLRRLVDSYRQVIGPLPAHVLLLAVQQVLETPVGTPADETGREASAA